MKLAVSQPTDPLEQEADSVADAVMGSTAAPSAEPGARVKPAEKQAMVHRKCTGCEEEDDKKKGMIAREGGGAAQPSEDAVASAETVVGAGSGRPLDPHVRSFMEERFGVDFGGTRVHTGATAERSAAALDARAYTLGQDIVFGPGRYAPDTTEGRRLIAHELTHVVQQSGARSTGGGEARHAGTIPGAHAGHAVGGTPTAARSIQRDKIDYRQLTWDDFKGTPRRGVNFAAETASDITDPHLAAHMPTKLVAEDTGEPCVLAKKKSGDVMGTTFKVDITIDPESIVLKPFMTQEKSWHRPWVMDGKAMTDRCKAGPVTRCHKAFTAAHAADVKAATKDCREQEKACKESFDKGNTSYELDFGGTKVAAGTKKECTSKLRPGCEKATVASATHTHTETSGGVTISADSDAACDGDFLQACVDELMPAEATALLSHEQGHFDITKLSADKAQADLRSMIDGFPTEVTTCGKPGPKDEKASKAAAVAKAKATVANHLAKLKAALKKARAGLRTEESGYDTETVHGTVAEEQDRWKDDLDAGNLPELKKKKK
jgi:hypothetical protein